MLDAAAIETSLSQLHSDQLRAALQRFLPQNSSAAQRVSTTEALLQSPAGKSLREAMAKWVVDEVVPVDALVPESYIKWRSPVRDCMVFVISRISPARLAPKLVEQLDLPPRTTPETRLLRLIAEVPGLQKLGQVIARNQHLRPALRNALARLENGIRDVKPEEIRAIIEKDVGSRLQRYSVKISRGILSEASVSAVVRFTWKNPDTGARERGVFKVLKPHIPQYFAEDMDYLQGLAHYFGDRHHTYGFPADLIPDTFKKVRRLLQHEVNFKREQKTLVEAWDLYRRIPNVRVPTLVRPLCTARITALTEESGQKVTSAAARVSASARTGIAEQLVEALVAVPLFSSRESAIFHGDPHAGNLLYDTHSGELTIIDWALRERLSRDQRRHLALLFLMLSLRDHLGASEEVLALSQYPIRTKSRRAQKVRELVTSFIADLPSNHTPGGVDAMKLLERVAVAGVKFPAPLIMLSKVMFTLDGLLADICGANTGMSFALARQVARHWLTNRSAFRSPLQGGDWVTLQCSALLYPSRMWLRWEKALLNRFLPPRLLAAATTC
jgi:ubiquinone biosynthesis protein